MSTDAPPTDTSTRTAYEPSEIEDKWYAFWEDNGFFEVDPDSGKEPHVIMMPPPNVTGRLHIGHALQDSIQDALTRIRRMQGYEAMWMPGLDHAGIATQNVVEQKLADEEELTRHDLGREAFVERVQAWKEEYGDIILRQKRKLGDSCDWDRQYYTMDADFSRAVQEVFVRLHEEGLIYRGDYLVNWDPKNETALSDEEVENVERQGHLWYVRYPLSEPVERDGDPVTHVTIATTRPETMLGDTAIAVSPDDERYADLVGKTAVLPLLNREIPIIADDYIDSDFGTGALKVTPAHDENDFEIGQRHDLETINVMTTTGRINENGGPYEGLDRFEARDAIVADLEAEGLIETVEDHVNSVPISDRSGAVIEPLISRQWFVKMEPLAEPAIDAVRDGEIQFHPERWSNEYFRWMENIRDWCISRQLWWGHRIPVWYYTDDEGTPDPEQGYVVSIDCPEDGMVQDEDVLDTWFSSWLVPFASLGWPDDTKELEVFYPTDVLVSGYDILFFWIARMIMAGYQFTGQPVYSDVFITGMVKDEQGRWMSKSLGNGIDPLEMVEQYGADATRFTLTILCAQGQDIKLAPSKFEMGRNFANKIWNAFNVFGQFMETDDDGLPTREYRSTRSFDELELVEQWMLHRLNAAIEDMEDSLTRYRLNEMAQRIYDVFWRDYCDWYLELIKPPYGEEMSDETIALAVEIFETLLKLLHPFMPFITEELWWKVRPREADEACIVADWPTVDTGAMDADRESTFTLIQEMISGIRGIKSDYGVGLGKEVAATISVPKRSGLDDAIRAHAGYFEKLASVTDLTVEPGAAKPAASASVVVGRCEVFVPLAGMIDLDQERERLRKEIEQKEGFLQSVEKKLNNPQFVSKAPDEVVDKERQKKEDATAELDRLRANLKDLQDVDA